MQPWTQNCGVRLLPLDFRDQYFGCEIELTGINRATAAQTLADLFGTRAEHSGGGYDAYRVKDLDGKEWKIVRDSSIHPECRRRSVLIGETYKVELNSPKLEYGEMEKLQEVVRSLRRAGGIVNDSCGMHVHVDASKHTPQSLKNVLSIMYSKEDILFAALKVNPARIDSYCQAVDEPILEEIRKLPAGASMDMLKDRWYRGRDGSDYHYDQSRYHACNLHSVFGKGSRGSSSDSLQTAGRELCMPDEIRRMRDDECLLLMRSEDPAIDRKYNLLKHPNVKYTPDAGGEPYVMPPDYMGDAVTITMDAVAAATAPEITEEMYEQLDYLEKHPEENYYENEENFSQYDQGD